MAGVKGPVQALSSRDNSGQRVVQKTLLHKNKTEKKNVPIAGTVRRGTTAWVLMINEISMFRLQCDLDAVLFFMNIFLRLR